MMKYFDISNLVTFESFRVTYIDSNDSKAAYNVSICLFKIRF